MTDPGSYTFGDLIELHIADMKDVGRPPRRSKAATLKALKARLGQLHFNDLSRECLINFGKNRARCGAGPVTVSAEIGYIRTVTMHAAAVHGIEASCEAIDLARIALKRLGLIGQGRSRDRRPTQSELKQIITYLDGNPRQTIPLGRIIRFALATGMRQEEICRITWADLSSDGRVVMVRDRKDPRDKNGNNQKVPLLDVTGLDARMILLEQRLVTGKIGRIFPYNSRSVGTAFRRACQTLKIQDLRFHDLRHEAATRLFEVGLSIEQVALVTGHRDWKMLRRYTHLRPEDLHSHLSKRKNPYVEDHARSA